MSFPTSSDPGRLRAVLRSRRIVLVGALALLAALVLWSLFRGDAPQTVTLSDGTQLTLYSVTAATNCAFRTGNILRQMADKLPRRWADKFGTQVFLQTSVPETNLFLKVVSHGKRKDIVPVRFRFVHEGGTEDVRFATLSRSGLPTGERAWLFHTSVWPRRSRYITVQPYLLGENIGERPASPGWRIKNPLYRDYPQWQAEVLPGRRVVGRTTFILEDLIADPELSRRSPDSEIAVFAQARLRVLTAEKADEGWETCGVQFRDPTGNRMQSIDRAYARRMRNGELSLPMAIPLLAGERAGKVGVAFVPTKTIPESEIFWLRGLAARPKAGLQISSVPTNTPFGPVVVKLILVALGLTEGIEVQVGIAQANALPVDWASTNARGFVVLEATDEQGRTYAPAASPEEFSDVRRFRLPPDVKSLDVKAAMPRVVFVEYTVGRESITPAAVRPRE